MDFDRLLHIAAKNDRKAQKQPSTSNALLTTKFSAPKKEVKVAKGVQSAAVRAFLEKKEKEERDKAEHERKKKEELLKLRRDAQHDRKAHAMASRTKDNLKIFNGACEKDSAPEQMPVAPVETEVDLKHLFTKHDQRRARLPSEHIPNMLEVLKEREKLRKQAKEEEEKQKLEAAAAADAAKLMEEQRKGKELRRDEERNAMLKSGKFHSSGSSSSHTKFPSNGSSHSGSQFKIPRKAQPPPLSFEQLMELAQRKQTEPLQKPDEVVEPQSKQTSGEFEFDRPMTKEEKERIMRRQTKEYQEWLNKGGPPPPSLSTSAKKGRAKQVIGRRSESPESGSDHRSSSSNELNRSSASHRDIDSQHSSKFAPQLKGKSNAIAAKQSRVDPTSSSSLSFEKKSTDSDRRPLPRESHSSSDRTINKLQSKSSSHLDTQRPDKSRDHSSVSKVTQDSSRKPGNSVADSRNSAESSLSNLGDLGVQLIERLKQQRREMADRGDAVPSLNDMLQDLLGKLTGGAGSSGQEKPKQSNGVDKTASSVEASRPRDKSSSSLKVNGERMKEDDRKLVTNPSSKPSVNEKSDSARSADRSRLESVKSTAPSSFARQHDSPARKLPSVRETILPCGKATGSTVSSQRDKSSSSSMQKAKSTWDIIQEQNRQKSRKPEPVQSQPKKRRIESDEEDDDYDDSSLEEEEEDEDDMDDFIDDTEDNTDYSSYIRQFFGYDKRRYKDERDDDLRDMEASFTQQMKEEARSARLGMLEDLEDMRREEEENARKLAKKNKKLRTK